MSGNIIEVGTLLDQVRPSRPDAEKQEQATASDVAKYVKSLQEGKSKDDVVDNLKARIEKIQGFDKEDLEFTDSAEEKGEFDWLVSEGKDATVSGKAKNEIAALVATLSDNLTSVRNPNSALLFKKDASQVMELLMNSLSLKSEATEENLNYVQREVRSLVRDSLSRGRASQSIDAASVDYVTKMFSSDEAESVKATVDLIRQVGLKKLTKENAGFVGALSRSYGSLGKSLSQFVFNKVKDLTTKPLTMISESADELQDDVKNQILALKEEVFNETFEKIEEKWDKKSDKLIREGAEGEEDSKFLTNYRSLAHSLFVSEDRDSAETNAKELTAFLSNYATRSDASASLMREADSKARELGRQKSAKDERVIVIGSHLIGKLLDGGKLNDDILNDLKEHVLKRAEDSLADDTPISVSKEDILSELESIKPGTGTASYADASGDNRIEALNSDHLAELKKALNSDGTIGDDVTWSADLAAPTLRSTDETLDNQDYDPSKLINFIKEKIETQKEASKKAERDEAEKLLAAGTEGVDPSEIVKQAKNVYLPISKDSSQGVKDLADKLKDALIETKNASKKDKKYYDAFLKNVNSWILTPILTKSPTIAKTNGAALMASIIDDDGTLNEDFFTESFESFTNEAKQSITDIQTNAEAEVEALKETAISKAHEGTVKIVDEIGFDSYENLTDALKAAISGGSGNTIKDFAKLLSNSNINIDEKTQELIDDANKELKGYDLYKNQAKLAAFISTQVVALKNIAKSSSSLSRLGDSAKRDLESFIQKVKENEELNSIDKDKDRKIQTTLTRLNSQHFAKINDKEKDLEALAEIQGSDDIWELKDNTDIAFPDEVRDVFKTLDGKFRTGLKNILGSMGLFYPSMLGSLRDKVAAIDEDSASTGLLSTVHAQLTALANDNSNKADESNANTVANAA